MLLAVTACAHRLDEYLQATLLAPDRDGVGVELRLTPGVAVLPQVLPLIDRNSDGRISAEEEAAEFIKANVTKPMSAYIAGVTAPEGKKMGHAGAITSGGKGTAKGKMDALRAAGVKVGQNPTEAGDLMAEIVKGL